MKLTNFQYTRSDDRNRLSALVQFEDSSQPDKKVFIETSSKFDLDIQSCPHAFLVGCLIPALHFGEKRLYMDADICPGLFEGLQVVMALMKQWSGGIYEPLKIETGITGVDTRRLAAGRAGMLFSGGIDSLAALRLNRLRYQKAHPGYIKDCLFIHGFDIGGVVQRGAKYHVFDRAFEAMKRVTEDAGALAIPVYTNLRHLCDDRDLWLGRFFGAVLAAIAHGFAGRFDLFYIASSYDLANLGPCGSHPLLDPEYSSFNLRIRHRDVELSRLEKLKIVSEWNAGFQNLRVCLANVQDLLNCGKCEKCVRTMTGLVAIDALHKTRAFVQDDVTPEMFEPFRINIRHRDPFYTELLPELKLRGRDDLVRVIEKKLKE